MSWSTHGHHLLVSTILMHLRISTQLNGLSGATKTGLKIFLLKISSLENTRDFSLPGYSTAHIASIYFQETFRFFQLVSPALYFHFVGQQGWLWVAPFWETLPNCHIVLRTQLWGEMLIPILHLDLWSAEWLHARPGSQHTLLWGSSSTHGPKTDIGSGNGLLIMYN